MIEAIMVGLRQMLQAIGRLFNVIIVSNIGVQKKARFDA